MTALYMDMKYAAAWLPSPSGESLRVYQRTHTLHLEKQVQGLDPVMEYKVSLNSRQQAF